MKNNDERCFCRGLLKKKGGKRSIIKEWSSKKEKCR